MNKIFLKFDLIAVTFFINLLGLAVPIYVIQALARYLAQGSLQTLLSLTVCVLIACLIELFLRHYRRLVIQNFFDKSDDINKLYDSLYSIDISVKVLNEIKIFSKIKRIKGKNSQKRYK